LKKLALFPGYLTTIVLITTLALACKTSNKVASTADQNDIALKFEKLYIEASTQFSIGNYSVALTQFNKCADLKPQEASVYYQISRIKQKQNAANDAFQNASKANALNPTNKFYAYHYGRLLRSNGDYKKAIEILQICINGNPKDENLFNQLDELYAIQGETNKQIALWNQYSSNVGLKSKTGLKLIELYKKINDLQSAHRIYDELKKGAPNKVQFYIDDAILYESQKDETNAMLNYEKAIRINPNNWDINYALFKFYYSKNVLSKATQYLSSAFQSSTSTFETKLNGTLSILKLTMADSNRASYLTIAASELVNSYPQNPKALCTAAELFFKCKNFKTASQYYLQATSLDPNLYNAWKGAIDCNLVLNKLDETVGISEQAITFFPNTSDLYEILADAYRQKNDYIKALDAIQLAERYSFDDLTLGRILFTKTGYLFQLKKYTEAAQAIDKCIEINKTDGALYSVKGNILFRLNNIEKAIENWQKAKDLGYKIELMDKKIREKSLYE
jgi:tetratricopeptide (TPR) repeat protein